MVSKTPLNGAIDSKNSYIFAVDDEAANLKLLDKVLGKQGYKNIKLIQDPREVIHGYLEQRPDLILLDLNMPYIDGYGVINKLKELNDPLLPPIVILTAQHGKDYLTRALNAGVRDFITKPYDTNELQMRVRNLLDAQLAHRMIYNQKAVLESMVQERTEELRNTQLKVVQRLGRAAEYRDEETGNHILRMSHMSVVIAKAYGWSEEQCDLLLNASPMHDIGKIGIPDGILLKPGQFESHEWEIMKTHSSIGAELLADDSTPLMKMAYDIALTHHEKWDGSGYPNGLKGAQIPESGRICAIADVFDALTSVRPYKRAWSIEKAIDFIKESRGTQFDSNLVDSFLHELPKIIKIRLKYSEAFDE